MQYLASLWQSAGLSCRIHGLIGVVAEIGFVVGKGIHAGVSVEPAVVDIAGVTSAVA